VDIDPADLADGKGRGGSAAGHVEIGGISGSSYSAPFASGTNRRSRGSVGGPAHIFIHFAVYVVLLWII
jgi:hypothetical protein